MADIRSAMTDRALFGATFGGPTWAGWRALLAGFHGLPLDPSEAEAFATLTGRAAGGPCAVSGGKGAETAEAAHAGLSAPLAGLRELWVVAGRRAGKSHAAALAAVFEAAFRDHRDKLAAGEVATVMLIAGDRAQARTLLRYVRGMCEHPLIRPMVVREGVEGLEFRNRSAVEVHTASQRAVRGYTLAAVVMDEIAFWTSEGANPDAEVLAALRPALATLDGRLIAISSPHARRGVLWETYRRAFGKPDPRVLVARAPSRLLNPGLPERVVAEALADDPARASAEWLAEFRSDLEQFLSVDVIASARRSGPLELPRTEGAAHVAFADMSGGGADEHAMSIAHRDGERVVVDVARGRKGDPEAAVAEFAALAKAYGCGEVRGDKYAGAWVPQAFRRHGVTYRADAPVRSELYLAVASALNAGQVELPPCDLLARQFGALERRVTRGGRDLIDHPPGAHDDRANAVAGAVASVLGKVAAGGFIVLDDGPGDGPGEFRDGVRDLFPWAPTWMH